MEPLYDASVSLVGWIEPGQHIFDTDMNWVAYIAGGHGWSAASGNWCGPVNLATCLDREGHVVAWTPAQQPQGTIRPVRPVRAVRAVRPVRPVRPVLPVRPGRPIPPIGGWSRLSFSEWVAGE